MTWSAALREPGAADFFIVLLRRPLIPIVLLAGGGFAAFSFWLPPNPRPGPLSAASGRPAVLVGRVAGYPTGRPEGDFFPLRVHWVRFAGAPAFRVGGEVSVFRKKPTEALTWGDSVSVWGPLVSAEGGPRAPGRAMARIFVPEGRSALLKRASPWNPLRWAASLRAKFHDSFHRHLPGVAGDLLGGVVLGERPPSLSDFAEDFRRSGTYHLLVASGSNVGFALGAWWFFSRWVLWWPRRWTLVTAPLASFLYAFMAGGDAPVLRAAVMASAASVGALLGRWDRLEQPLFLSAGILLLWDPSSLFNAGFQMSYAATLAIATVWGRSETDDFSVGARSNGLRLVGRWIRDLFVTSLAAQIALAPLLLYYFGRFSWAGLLANILAVPLAGVCLSLGAGLAFLDGFWPAAASLWAIPTRWGAETLAGWARLCARLPGAEWHHTLNGPQALALAVGITAGFIALKASRRLWAVLPPLSLGVLIVVFGLATPERPGALDLSWRGGKASAVRIQTSGRNTLIESGTVSRSPADTGAVRRVPWRSEGVDLDPGWVDGRVWTEGGTRWEVVRPGEKGGFALWLEHGETSVFLNFGLTARQQKAWLLGQPRSADLVSWIGGKGGPPTDRMLAVLRPRWVVMPSSRVPRSVRRAGAALYHPRGKELHWRAEESTAGFSPSSKNW